MSRDELKGKQTKGEMHLSGVGAEVYGGKSGMHLVKIRQDGYEYRADAALYAEAHNVANSTGMWPQDLVDRVKELEYELRNILDWHKEERTMLGEQELKSIKELLNKSNP